MKSIKPGRGPSAMGAISAIFAAIFGIFWTFMAVSMGAPPFFALFGIIFIGMAVGQFFYHKHNATSKNRFSTFDITDSNEEIDPFERKLGINQDFLTDTDTINRFCPFCGTAVQENFDFCNNCGKKLP